GVPVRRFLPGVHQPGTRPAPAAAQEAAQLLAALAAAPRRPQAATRTGTPRGRGAPHGRTARQDPARGPAGVDRRGKPLPQARRRQVPQPAIVRGSLSVVRGKGGTRRPSRLSFQGRQTTDDRPRTNDMADLIQPRTLKGFRDYLPELMIPREHLLE